MIRDYEKAERAAVLPAAPAYHARRDAVAAGCLDVVTDGAQHRFVELLMLYGYWAAKPLIEVAQPEAYRLVRRLRRIPTRSRPLRRARPAYARRNRESTSRSQRSCRTASAPCCACLRRHGVSARVADVFQRGNADGYDSLPVDDPVLQAIEDAVNQS